LDQCALGQRHSHGLALSGVHAGRTPSAPVTAGDLQPGRAEVTGVVRPDEWRHDQVTSGEAGNLGADLLDDADELVAHPAALLVGWHRLIRPQVAAADAGGGDADDGVGGLAQDGIGHGLHTHVSGLVHDGCSHGTQSTSVSCGLAVTAFPGDDRTPQDPADAPSLGMWTIARTPATS